MSSSAAGLILGAGLASRFGSDKLAANFRGKPLLRHAVDAGRAADLSPLVLVARTALDWPSVRVIVNPDPQRGLSSSLRLGLAALAEAGEVERVVVLLGDQPLVSAEVIDALLAHPTDGERPIVVPRYAGGQPGNPVLLERHAWRLAQALTGDQGMRQLFAARPDLVRYVDVPGTNPDIDTPADLIELDRRER